VWLRASPFCIMPVGDCKKRQFLCITSCLLYLFANAPSVQHPASTEMYNLPRECQERRTRVNDWHVWRMTVDSKERYRQVDLR